LLVIIVGGSFFTLQIIGIFYGESDGSDRKSVRNYEEVMKKSGGFLRRARGVRHEGHEGHKEA
jgi:hypothetical protein